MAREAERKLPGAPPQAGTIQGLLRAASARAPHAMAILAPGRPALSYHRLVEQVQEVAGTLNGLGLGRGDRVALALPQGPEAAVAILGVAVCATCAPLNPACRAAEFGAYLDDLVPRALVVLRGTPSAARQEADARGIPVIELAPRAGAEAGVFDLFGRAAGGTAEGGPAGPEDVALVLHNSRSASRRRIVPLMHADLWHAARSVAASLRLTAEDRCLGIAPLFHVDGLVWALLAPLWAGGSVALGPGFEASRFFEWMDECRPTWYTAAPATHQAIIEEAAAHRAVITRRPLRLIHSAPPAPMLLADLQRTFNAPVLTSCGMMETADAITRAPAPPRTPLERELAALWREVLGLQEVGIRHSFLELGGDSVLAARLIARVCGLTGVALPVRSLFGQTPNIAAQAERVRTARKRGAALRPQSGLYGRALAEALARSRGRQVAGGAEENG